MKNYPRLFLYFLFSGISIFCIANTENFIANFRPDPPHSKPSNVRNKGLSHDDFFHLKHRMMKKLGDSQKVPEAMEVIRFSGIKSIQLSELLEILNFESSKLILAKNATPYVSDLSNLILIFRNFKYRNSEDEFYQYLTSRQLEITNKIERDGCISDKAFKLLCYKISDRYTESGKLDEAKKWSRITCLNTKQVEHLLGLFSFDRSRLEYVRFVLPNVCDIDNYFILRQEFNFESSRREFDEIIHNHHHGFEVCNQVYTISPQAFNQIISEMNHRISDSRKMEYAKSILSGTNFKAEQIAVLNRNFSFDSNRLEFAKLAYHSCVDPQKYFLVSETLEFRSNRDELERFISHQ
jgi:hypothetical protein